MKAFLVVLLALASAQIVHAQSSPPAPSDQNSMIITIGPPGGGGAQVTLRPDGTVELSEGLALDDAAKHFWAAVQTVGMKLACEPK